MAARAELCRVDVESRCARLSSSVCWPSLWNVHARLTIDDDCRHEDQERSFDLLAETVKQPLHRREMMDEDVGVYCEVFNVSCLCVSTLSVPRSEETDLGKRCHSHILDLLVPRDICRLFCIHVDILVIGVQSLLLLELVEV